MLLVLILENSAKKTKARGARSHRKDISGPSGTIPSASARAPACVSQSSSTVPRGHLPGVSTVPALRMET